MDFLLRIWQHWKITFEETVQTWFDINLSNYRWHLPNENIYKHHKTTISFQNQWFRNSWRPTENTFFTVFLGNISLAQTSPSENYWQSVSTATLIQERESWSFEYYKVGKRKSAWDKKMKRKHPLSSHVGWLITDILTSVGSSHRDGSSGHVGVTRVEAWIGVKPSQKAVGTKNRVQRSAFFQSVVNFLRSSTLAQQHSGCNVIVSTCS